ncbi:hypothetical protein J0S82_008486 [Galemys pyrenaicus]|uniref:Uncharacterized protein n=1 Tax=Galemys pyrenaicus TaxID=202257 RepID=A0A8J6AW11_GALPY|nr:hypothetical protein J0S82_008486 [Galemys pyrenaicus]
MENMFRGKRQILKMMRQGKANRLSSLIAV